jgi:hypothetical protein
VLAGCAPPIKQAEENSARTAIKDNSLIGLK